jgi:arylsulfatase A-like enzyme
VRMSVSTTLSRGRIVARRSRARSHRRPLPLGCARVWTLLLLIALPLAPAPVVRAEETGAAERVGTHAAEPPPNIVLVTIDTVRADHLSFYGYARDTTPNLSAWVGEGTVFENAYVPLPLTDPSLTSTMTGLYPIRTGVRHTSRKLDPKFTTLAQLLQARGYSTAAFVSRNGLVMPTNLGRGFDVANFVGGEHKGLTGERLKAERWQRRAKSVTTRTLAWLRRPPPTPFFLWIHYFDPHAFYDPPEPARARFEAGLEPMPSEGLHAWWGSPTDIGSTIARYDAEILTVDQHLARLVSALKQRGDWDSTLFVLTSDHGESLGEHGHLDHGEWLYHEQVRVPLVFRFPGRVPAGLRVPDLVRAFDLAATVLELVGAEGADVDAFVAGSDGASFAPVFAGNEIAPRKIFLESENCPRPDQRHLAPGMRCDPPGVDGKIRGVFDGRYKLIVTPTREGQTVELYDLREDPAELRDLSASDPERVAALRAEIAAHWREPAPTAEADGALVEKLRALGYTE